jgi:hypothetical protein
MPELITRIAVTLGMTDKMHGMLADALMSCVEGSPEEAELIDIIEAYESQRWPLGRIPGGKG